MTLKERQIATTDFKCLAAHSQYSLPVEVNNSTIELHLPVDSQYSLPFDREVKIDQVLLHGDSF